MKSALVIRHLMLWVALAAMCQTGLAQRKNVLGTQVDFFGGAMEQQGGAGFNFATLQKRIIPIFGVSPALRISSQGANSQLDLTYAFMWLRSNNQSSLNVILHNADMNFTARLSRSARLRLAERASSSNFSAFNVSSGAGLSSADFRYAYEPALARRDSISSNANAGLDLDVGPASYLTFAASSSYLRYGNIASFGGRLSNQLRFEGNLAYSRKLSGHHTWHVKYTIAQNRFTNYGNARTHSAEMGLSLTLSPTATLALEAGPTLTQSRASNRDSLGYRASASFSKIINANRLSLHASHSSGDSTGMGSVSDIDNAGLAFSRIFGKRTMIDANLSAFRGKGRLDNPYSTRGYYGATSLAFMLNPHLFLICGGSYRKNEGAALLNSTYGLLYLSIRFSAPGLWRGSR
ncbi:MAG: hypothetical protein LAP85_23250 [Acidobacteriia bacterium]|nr:hypothetical protein [Terriglobia bacterium]